MSEQHDNPDGADDISSGDSDIIRKPGGNPGLFQVYSAGEVTVVGFGGRDVPNDFWIGAYKDELASIVRESNCRELAFDLGGVTAIPSGMLGLLSSLRELDVTISLYNPSQDVREIVQLSNLDDLIEFREVDLDE